MCRIINSTLYMSKHIDYMLHVMLHIQYVVD